MAVLSKGDIRNWLDKCDLNPLAITCCMIISGNLDVSPVSRTDQTSPASRVRVFALRGSPRWHSLSHHASPFASPRCRDAVRLTGLFTGLIKEPSDQAENREFSKMFGIFSRVARSLTPMREVKKMLSIETMLCSTCREDLCRTYERRHCRMPSN